MICGRRAEDAPHVGCGCRYCAEDRERYGELEAAVAVIATLDARTIGRRPDEMGMEAIGRRSQELARAALRNLQEGRDA